MANKRVVSERVTSSKVVGRKLPIVGNLGKKMRNFGGSIRGVCIAPILIILSFGLLFFSERQKKNSGVVEGLDLEQASEVSVTSGLHKLQGTASTGQPVEAPEVGEVLYYSYKKETYEEVESTETETVTRVENGQEIEETIEKDVVEDEWVEKESQSKWAEIMIGDYLVSTSGAELKLDLSRKEFRSDVWGEYEDISSKSVTPEIGDERLVVSYLPLETELIVVGEVKGSEINGGEVFIITNKSDSDLVSTMKTEENTIYWVMKGGSWLLLTIGLLSIVGPILSLLDFIPVAGKAANCAASILAAVVSAVIVALGTIILKFWWLCLGGVVIGTVVLVAGLVFLIAKKADSKEEAGGEEVKENKVE